MPIIISKSGGEAVRVEQTSFANEIDLQRYIEAHPEAIPLDEIKENVDFLVLDREFPVSAGSIDALGVDSDGDLYIIETKLYKNPDKRRVVAQVLDYGAALWARSENPGEWISKLERRLSDKGVDLGALLEEKFGGSEEAFAGMVDNLSAGAFKFIILMDQVPSALKDLITYINQNSSFSVYGVELEYYEHGDLKILKPQVFGSELKRKAVSSTVSKSKRWDEDSFFEDLETNISIDELEAVRKLYHFSGNICDQMVWGTGSVRGSFNPRFEAISTTTLFGVYSDGNLQFHHNWMTGDQDFIEWRKDFDGKLLSIPPIRSIVSSSKSNNPEIPPSAWTSVVDEVIELLKSTLPKTD